jgi:hypothetical protein
MHDWWSFDGGRVSVAKIPNIDCVTLCVCEHRVNVVAVSALDFVGACVGRG